MFVKGLDRQQLLYKYFDFPGVDVSSPTKVEFGLISAVTIAGQSGLVKNGLVEG